MNQYEIDLVYKGIGNYKGWKCAEFGCGLVVMQKQTEVIKAYRGPEVKDWVPECWAEVKNEIDQLNKAIIDSTFA
ncbi:hypothetical protein [Paenibacillus sp. Leaf72]|uniref:hypothetical protein n=1 Tax=Paenibacillus sp. Leaf72 TaxID=1736234 RepID=UPI0006F937FD|nr:hypothetical protein [Paenibacillus sp. Leaf72]KQN96946.1 hypothetical protein ASF12_23030 [Paenibacillus sp. Leaf72]